MLLALIALAPLASADEPGRAGWIGGWGQVQTRATLWDQDVSRTADPATYGDPEDDPGFGLVRARLGLDGGLPMGDLAAGHQLEWAVSVGVGAPYDALTAPDEDLQLVDALGRWIAQTPIGPSSVTVGLQRVPLERGGLIRSADLLFQERTAGSEWLTPAREVGVVGAQAVDLGQDGPQILLRVGAFNGSDAIFADVDPGVRAVARLEFAAGDAYRTWSPDLENALGVGVGVTRNPELATTEAALAADVLARVKIVTLTGSLLQRTITPTDTVVAAPRLPTETVQRSFAGQLSVWIPVDGEHGVEVGGRYERFDDATHLDDLGDVALLHAGATWRSPLPGLDLGAGYVHRDEPHGGFDNDTVRVWTQIRGRVVR